MIYFDLAAETARLLAQHGATAWQPISVKIHDSPQDYLDSSFVEGLFLQEGRCPEGATWQTEGATRAQVSIGQVAGRPECVYTAPDVTRTFLYRNSVCADGQATPEELEVSKPTEFQPGCLVVLVEAESRAALLDELTRAGRVLTDPLKISFNFTKALSDNPDLDVASVQCAISGVIQSNHQRDMVGQEVIAEINSLNEQISQKDDEIVLWDETIRGLSAYRPPGVPPSPLAPLAPRPPPHMTFDQRLENMRDERSALALRLASLRVENGVCVPSPTTTCGRSPTAAPDPWTAIGGERCAGYATREALEGSLCGHWAGPHNVEAAESAEAHELLSGTKPWCYSESGKILDCPAVADRVIRSGVSELTVKSWLITPSTQ